MKVSPLIIMIYSSTELFYMQRNKILASKRMRNAYKNSSTFKNISHLRNIYVFSNKRMIQSLLYFTERGSVGVLYDSSICSFISNNLWTMSDCSLA